MMQRLKYFWIFSWSFSSLLLERLWNSFWPAFSVVFVFLAASFLNIPFLFDAAGHLAFLGIFAAAFLFCVVRLGDAFRFPRPRDVDRHIELESELQHRPIETLSDRPIETTDAEAYLLWDKHLQATKSAWKKLRIYQPEFTAARHDRYALRHAAMLLLVISLVIARHDAWPRLQGALQPDLSKIVQVADAKMDVWIEPPAYTGAAPIFLSSASRAVPLANTDAPVTAPEGSVLKLRLAGYRFKPLASQAGHRIPLTSGSGQSFTAEMPLKESGKLAIRPFFSAGKTWDVTVTPDLAPAVTIVTTDKTARGALKISYQLSDDYGVAKLGAKVKSADGSDSVLFDMTPPSGPTKGEAILTHTQDLTSSPLAGGAAILTLTAEDSAGHITESAPMDIALPEKTFNNPTAIELVFERKRLIRYDNPLTRHLAFMALAQIANHPAYYNGDTHVFLALDVATKRLAYDGDAEAVASVEKLLWDVALRVEDGGLSSASKDLAEALQKLTAALDDKNTSQSELQKLMEDVHKKMREYMQSLSAEMQQRMAQGKNTYMMSPELAAKFMQHIDMNQLLKQMQALMQGGSREDMRKMAEALKDNIENLDLNRMDQMQQSQQEAMQALEDMQKLLEHQQSLFDRTNKMSKDNNAADEAKNAAPEQDMLRKQLGDITRKIGEAVPDIPENFGKADQAMKAAGGKLGKGDPTSAAPDQKTAMDELQKAMDGAVQKMAEQMQQAMMSFGAGGSQSQNFGGKYDPLGRSGTASDGDVKIPDESERRRVQEIIKELRGRSNDYQRPKVERDYLDRLLEKLN